MAADRRDTPHLAWHPMDHLLAFQLAHRVLNARSCAMSCDRAHLTDRRPFAPRRVERVDLRFRLRMLGDSRVTSIMLIRASLSERT